MPGSAQFMCGNCTKWPTDRCQVLVDGPCDGIFPSFMLYEMHVGFVNFNHCCSEFILNQMLPEIVGEPYYKQLVDTGNFILAAPCMKSTPPGVTPEVHVQWVANDEKVACSRDPTMRRSLRISMQRAKAYN